MFQWDQAARIRLVPEARVMTDAPLRALSSRGRIFACDFHVEGIEGSEPHAWGWRSGSLHNVDHHAPDPCMEREVSSATLALEWLRHQPAASGEDVVAINHSDCDSVLSAGLMSGVIPAQERFSFSAVAADHTGESDAVADLLQALQSVRDPRYSLRALEALLTGAPLDERAGAALAEHLAKRELATRLVRGGGFQTLGRLHHATVDRPLDGEFFTPLLPEAEAIAVFWPSRRNPGRWNMRLRLGPSAPAGRSLHQVAVREVDPNYGGRWNAGSNQRGGGSELDPEEYARRLAAVLDRAWVPDGTRPGMP